jgi:glycolate oxidase iron-sulfur subunit
VTAPQFAGLSPCVHCGFCLQSCPTFLATGDEADSPRGRIVLMQALARGELPAADDNLTLHLDRCLGCRACEPVCPSGVEYGGALEEARRLIARERPVPWPQRAVHAAMAEPVLRAPAMALARMVRPFAHRFAGASRLGFAMGMLAATRRQRRQRRQNAHVAAAAAPAAAPASAAVFEGCIMSGLFSHVHDATRRTLAVNGYPVVSVQGQGCCGALHAHAGQHDDAARLARANVRAFAQAPDALIAVNSAGCGAALKEYGRLLVDDPLAAQAAAMGDRVRDITELLADRGPRRGGDLRLRVAYDPPCHLLHAQRVADAPERVLAAVPGVERAPVEEADLCCGSAGSYSLMQAEMSRRVLSRKLDALARATPDVVATGNPGCVMQIGAGLRARGLGTPVVHPVEILDWSYTRLEANDG